MQIFFHKSYEGNFFCAYLSNILLEVRDTKEILLAVCTILMNPHTLIEIIRITSFYFVGIACLAIVNSNTAAASSMIIWIILDLIVGKSRGQNAGVVSIPGACSAIVVGLVVITPGAGYVQPGYALLMGLIGGAIVFLLLLGKKRYFHIDDTLDVFTCHGIGGTIGIVLTGLFCQTNVNNSISNGAIYGQPIQLWYQMAGVLVVTAFSAGCTAAILLPMHFLIGIRIDQLDQVRGLDNVTHGVIEQGQPKQQVKPIFLKQKPIFQP
jgi:ammonia channel protein AmtB